MLLLSAVGFNAPGARVVWVGCSTKNIWLPITSPIPKPTTLRTYQDLVPAKISPPVPIGSRWIDPSPSTSRADQQQQALRIKEHGAIVRGKYANLYTMSQTSPDFSSASCPLHVFAGVHRGGKCRGWGYDIQRTVHTYARRRNISYARKK